MAIVTVQMADSRLPGVPANSELASAELEAGRS